MGFIERLAGNKDILSIKKANTRYGDGFEIEVALGSSGEKKECSLIQDKDTGEWKTFGDPRACRILSDNLEKLGSPLAGSTTGEKLAEPPVF